MIQVSFGGRPGDLRVLAGKAPIPRTATTSTTPSDFDLAPVHPNRWFDLRC
jgi:hypothetical protein